MRKERHKFRRCERHICHNRFWLAVMMIKPFSKILNGFCIGKLPSEVQPTTMKLRPSSTNNKNIHMILEMHFGMVNEDKVAKILGAES